MNFREPLTSIIGVPDKLAARASRLVASLRLLKMVIPEHRWHEPFVGNHGRILALVEHLSYTLGWKERNLV